MNVQEIPISQIETAKYQLRGSDDSEKEGQHLQNSITTLGLIQPVIVQAGKDGKYILVAGHRRLSALKAGGQEKAPAVVFSSDETEAVKMALTENLIRRPLNTLEIIKGLQMLEEQGVQQKDIAELFGWTKAQVSNLLAISKVNTKAQTEMYDALKSGEIYYGHAKALLALRNYPEALLEVLNQVRGVPPNCTVRVAENLVRKTIAKMDEKKYPKLNFSLPDNVMLEERAKSARLIIHFTNREELKSILTEFMSKNGFHVKTKVDAESKKNKV